MSELFDSLVNLFAAAFGVIQALVMFVLPYAALISWVAFWTLAVNWVKLYEILFKKGGVVGLILICLMSILVWGLIAPPIGGHHELLGMKLSNFIAKIVFVSSLVTIMFLCGSVQLSGSVAAFTNFDEPEPDTGHGGHGHGHDDGHGAADHGHGGHAPSHAH